MFDIGFMELLLIGIVALLVLGPDKLPGAIRTGALWFGRAKRSFNKVKSEIEQQINTDEIRRQLHNESILGDIKEARKNADKLIKDTQSEIRSTEDSVKRSMDTTGKSITSVKATTSADEGIPTPPPENYVANKDAISEHRADESETTIEPEAPKPQATDEPAPEPVPETEDTRPSQDIYSTPPSGIVSMQNGKFSAVNDKPTTSDSSSGKN